MPRPEMSDRLVWIDLEMTGLDTVRHTIVEIAVLVTDSELELVDEGIDLIVHASPEDLALMDDFVTKMHTKSGLLPAIEASTLSLADAGTAGHRVPRDAAPRARDRAAVRQLDRRGPALPRPVPPRARPVPALPQRGRQLVQGAVPALVPVDLQAAAGQAGDPPRARRHPGVHRGDALLPGQHAGARRRSLPDRPPHHPPRPRKPLQPARIFGSRCTPAAQG